MVHISGVRRVDLSLTIGLLGNLAIRTSGEKFAVSIEIEKKAVRDFLAQNGWKLD